MHTIISTPQGIELARFSPEDQKAGLVVQVEGNWYLDSSLVHMSLLQMVGDGKNYHCPIKQAWCDYYSFVSTDETVSEIAWIYPTVANTLFQSIAGKVGFWKGKYVESSDANEV
jgi:uncharacterized protein (DUF427 family)